MFKIYVKNGAKEWLLQSRQTVNEALRMDRLKVSFTRDTAYFRTYQNQSYANIDVHDPWNHSIPVELETQWPSHFLLLSSTEEFLIDHYRNLPAD